MGIFEYNQDELLGTVESVDTSTAIIKVENDDKLKETSAVNIRNAIEALRKQSK